MRALDEVVLMPRYARRPPRDAARTALDPVRRADEREIAMLEGQLSALDRDIKNARACVSRPPGGTATRRGHEVDVAHGMRDGRVRLTDGREICIRPIEPCDAPELKAGFQRLTAVSRYRRFLSGLDHLTANQLRYLTTVDHADHEALVALEARCGAGIGVARYVRDANDPRLAEIAIVVTDAWQACGVGTALLERLESRARAAGIERLIGRSIVGDHAAAALAAHVGDVIGRRRRPGTVELTVQLRASSGTQAAQRSMRRATAGSLPDRGDPRAPAGLPIAPGAVEGPGMFGPRCEPTGYPLRGRAPGLART